MAPLSFTRDSRENENYPRWSLADSLAKMAAPVSINLFHFALENSVQKGERNSNEKNAQYEALKTVVVDGKDTVCVLPAEYGRSLSDWLPD